MGDEREKRSTGVGEALSLAVEVAEKLGSERLDRVFPANALASRDPLLAMSREKRVTGVGDAIATATGITFATKHIPRVAFPANALALYTAARAAPAPRDPLLAMPLEKVAASLIEQAAAALHGGTTKGPTHAWCGDCGEELQRCECGVVRRVREAVHVAMSDGRLVPAIRTSEGAGAGRWVETVVQLADIAPRMGVEAEWLEKPIPEKELKRNRAERRKAESLARRRTK